MTEVTPFVRPELDDDLVSSLLTIPVVAATAERQLTLAPFDGRPLADIPHSTAADVDRAFDSARSAQHRWAATPVAHRAKIALRFHDMLVSHRDEGLDLIQWETGKTRMDALKELLAVAAVARYYGTLADRILRSRRPLGLLPGLTRVHVQSRPVGVVGCISAWNYPLFLAAADAIPALVAGNAVVLKPDHKTSLIALWVVDLLHRSGVPPRVLQVVLGYGPQLGPEVIERADFVMFTGSSAVGSTIAARCGERLIGCSLELGGKNPMIVTADADISAASEIAMRACFDNAGQLCVGIERIYAVGDAYEGLVRRMISRISAMRMRAEVGWGSDYGSLIGQAQLDRVSAVVQDAVAQGATVLTGGRPLPEIGPYFFAPTLLEGVGEGMTAHRDETFGPVVAVHRVATEEEAVALANDSEFGLNASIVCGDPDHGVRLARMLNTGTVNVNEGYEAVFGSPRAPMGGMGRSGLGRRNGPEGLLRFTEEQAITVQRGLTVGTPPGMEDEEWGSVMTKGFGWLRRLGIG